MKYLFDELEGVKTKLRGKTLLLFLDFDGTLSTIVEHYQSATILAQSKALLAQIIKKSQHRVIIVSGRSWADVKKRVGLPNIIYVGNHGLEVSGPTIRYQLFVAADVKRFLKEIKACLTERLGQIPGILIEDKDLTLSIHYRRLEKKDLPLLKRIFFHSIQPYVKDRKATVGSGKRVFEVKPAVDWNKGNIVLWLIKRLQADIDPKQSVPIFIGDDVTDEAAFTALKRKGICIRVGQKGVSAAQYYVKDVDQVAEFLKAVISLNS